MEPNNCRSLNKAFQYYQIGHITSITEPIHINSGIDYVRSEFLSNLEFESIPIESDSGVVGIIERTPFLSSTKSLVGSIIHNSLEYYLTKKVIIIDARCNCEKALQQIFDAENPGSIENFLVYNKGRFYGVLNMFGLIKHILFLRNTELLRAKKIQEYFISHDSIETDYFWAGASIKMAHEVGGDFFQIKKLRETLYMVSSFDVCGKDLSASMYTTIIGSFFSTMEEYDLLSRISPVELIMGLHNVVRKNSEVGVFIAGVFFFIDMEENLVKIFNLGFSPLYIINKNKEKKKILKIKNPQFPPLGLEEFKVLEKEALSIPFSEDLRFVTYSDGLSDAQNKSGDVFGEENIKKFVIENAGLAKRDFLKGIMHHIMEFIDNTPQIDDITVLHIDFRKL